MSATVMWQDEEDEEEEEEDDEEEDEEEEEEEEEEIALSFSCAFSFTSLSPLSLKKKK